MKRGILRSLVCASLLVILAACGGNVFDIAINENIEVEYGEELDHTILYDAEKSEKDLTVKEVRDFDKMKIGEQEITVVFALGEDTQEEKVKVNVKDTKAPEITFKSETVEITLGDAIDTAANIESVKDPVDGDITRSDDTTITENGYFVMADIKSEAGEYTVSVVAYDLNGNKTEKSYQLVIKEKDQATENQPVSSNQGGSSQAPTQNGGTQSQVPASNGSNASSSQPAPSQPKVVCPNGKEPLDPNLPCDTILTGRNDNYSQCYKNASGLVLFPTSQEAYTWAKNAWLSGEIEGNYSSYVTTPLSKNNQTSCYCVTFMK